MSNKKDLFYSTDNFNMLYEILSLDIQKKFSFDISNSNECRQILFSNMESTFLGNKNKNLKDINIITIKNTGPLLYKQLSRTKNSEPKIQLASHQSSKEIPIRDISLGKKLPEYTNMRPEFYQKEQSITDNYEKLNQERNESQLQRQPEINFSLPISTQNDTDPNEMFQYMNNKREQENKLAQREKHNQFNQQNGALENFENMSQQIKNTEQQILENNNLQQQQQYQLFSQQQKIDSNKINNNSVDKKTLEDDISLRNDVSSISEIEKRIYQDEQIRIENNSQDLNPSIIYKKDDNLEKEYQTIMSKPIEPINFDHQDNNLKSKSRKKKNYLEIESIDRLLENSNHSRYSFKVSFSPAFKQLKKMPLFENNPFILATPEQSKDGRRGDVNDRGWNDNNGNIYPPYDASKPFGNIVTYEDITLSGTNNLYIQNNFRNITEIKVVNLIIPYEYANHFADISPASEKDMIALREPYLLINIQEINGIYNSTSQNITDSFCKLIRNDDWNSDPRESSNKNQYHGNIQFVPSINGVSKTYYPSPLASLNSFTIQILRPNGELISTSKDYANIRYINYQSPSNIQVNENSHLMIKLDTFVDSTIFKTYSNIILKDYRIPIDSDLCVSKSDFEAFVNRPSGHTIVSIGTDKIGQTYGYINLIYISSQGNFNDTTGDYEVYDYGDSINFGVLKNYLNKISEIYKDDSLNGNNPFGTVFNTSYQSHISLEITTLESDTEELKVRLI